MSEPAGVVIAPGRTSSSLAAVAVVVCAAAFLLGLIPVLGFLLGITGIALVVVAAKKQRPSKLSIAGGVMALIATLASMGTTVALVVALALSTGPETPEPVAGPPSADDEATDEDTEATDASPEEPEETQAEGSAAPEPEEPSVAETSPVETTPPPTQDSAPDLEAFEEVDERTLAQIVKAPDDHVGQQIILYGHVTQLDAATGPCMMRVSASHTQQGERYAYEHNTVGYSGDAVSECPVLDPLVTDDEVKLWVTIDGSISYDTQIGGNTIVPAYEVVEAELL